MNLPGLNFDLGSDLDMLREAVRDFAQAEIAPRAAAADLARRIAAQAGLAPEAVEAFLEAEQ